MDWDQPPETSAPARAPRPLVPVARRTPPIHFVPLWVVLTLAFAIVASLVPFNSQSPMAVFLQTILFALTTGYILLAPDGDRLSAFRVASIFFVLSFCIGDLFNESKLVWFFVSSYPDLLTRAAALALLCYVMMLIGYHIPAFGRIPQQVTARHETVDARLVTVLSLAFFVIGVVFFVVFFLAAGGAAVILQGEGGVSRVHFGRGIGILFWPSLWMTSGAVMYFAAQLYRGRSLLIAGIPLLTEFALLALLQGRHRALGPLLMGLAVAHYLSRPVRLPRLAALAVAAAVFSIIMGAVRSPTVRAYAYSNPARAVEEIRDDMGHHFTSLMTQDIGCMVKTMIIIDKIPLVRDYGWGESLRNPLNPVFRILGFPEFQGVIVGDEGYMLARPELALDPSTTPGFLPSLPGEIRWNFPWYVGMFFYLGYGLLLRAVYVRLIVRRADFASVGIYAVLGLYLTEMVFQSVSQNVFELVDIIVPMFLIRFLATRRTRTVPVPFELPGVGDPEPPGHEPAPARGVLRSPADASG